MHILLREVSNQIGMEGICLMGCASGSAKATSTMSAIDKHIPQLVFVIQDSRCPLPKIFVAPARTETAPAQIGCYALTLPSIL